MGKTTVSSAFAVHCALKQSKSRVLLISTDPAHSLSDLFEQPFGSRPAKVNLDRAQLDVWQVDAKSRFQKFLNKERQQILSILETGSIFNRDDIAPLLDTALPGMAEMSALLAIHDSLNSSRYDQIVVDTAPFGHTLRMFEMPEHFVRFLDFLEFASRRDEVLAEHFGGARKTQGSQVVARWRKMTSQILSAFSRDARVFLVTTPEPFSLNESLRCRDVMRSESPSLKVSDVILNRVVKRPGLCRVCKARATAAQRAQEMIRQEFPSANLLTGEDPGTPIVGVKALQNFGAHVFRKKALKVFSKVPRSPKLQLKTTNWPLLITPLSLVLGKGGVGKTTVSAGLGYVTREKTRFSVEICSVDPAPSLDDIFESEVGDTPTEVFGDPKFRASEMDAAQMFQHWIADIKQTLEQPASKEGLHVDFWFERQLFSQLLDSIPPGLDEILAVFRIIDLVAEKKRRIVIDLAPTGHALELLRTPERILAWTRLLLKTLSAHRTLAIARDAGVRLAELGQRVREFLSIIQDPEKTRVFVVALAEPLPDHETRRLVSALEELNTPAGALVVNRVMVAEPSNCPRCRRAQSWQKLTLARIFRQHPSMQTYVVNEVSSEISGKEGVRKLTRRIWQAK